MDDGLNGSNTLKPKNLISSILGGTPGKPKPLAISNPHDFRQVKCIMHYVYNPLIDLKLSDAS